MKHIYKLPAYVGIILKQEDQVLLVQRHSTQWKSGYWNFPGGLLEENETLAAAAAREAYEEIGVIIDPLNCHLTHVLHVHADDNNTQDIIGCYFFTESWQGSPINKEPHRHSNIGWFPIATLPTQITEHALLALQSITDNKKYSENGWN